jgi:translation initiation factor 3 subunit L
LYKELYFRHIYERLIATVDSRVQSWNNYVQLLSHFLSTTFAYFFLLSLLFLSFFISLFLCFFLASKDDSIPRQWLWDIFDSFIIQLTDGKKKCYNLNDKTLQQVSVISFYFFSLSFLYLFLCYSFLFDAFCLTGLASSCCTYFATKSYSQDQYLCIPFAKTVCPLFLSLFLFLSLTFSPFFLSSENLSLFSRHLGYFSLVSILHLHTVMGDYHSALKLLTPLDARKEMLLLPACFITAYYYMGIYFFLFFSFFPYVCYLLSLFLSLFLFNESTLR